MAIKAINPATGEQVASYEAMTDERVRDAISKAHNAFLAWRRYCRRQASSTRCRSPLKRRVRAPWHVVPTHGPALVTGRDSRDEDRQQHSDDDPGTYLHIDPTHLTAEPSAVVSTPTWKGSNDVPEMGLIELRRSSFAAPPAP
jgi:hypothetical protein